MLLQILARILPTGIIILIFDLYCVRSSCVLRSRALWWILVAASCSLVLHFVTVTHMFWDFGSLHLKASRRHSGQLLRQRQSVLSRLYASLA